MSDTSLVCTLARETLGVLGFHVSNKNNGIQPHERALELAAELLDLGGLAPEVYLTLADCAAGFLQLSQPKAGDESEELRARRTVCAQISRCAGSPAHGNALHLALVLREAAQRLFVHKDDRSRAFAAQCRREADELDD